MDRDLIVASEKDTSLIHSLSLPSDEFHKGKTAIPDTKGVEEGSTKRNIQRKHDHDPHRKDHKNGGGGGGKGKWNALDDGSM